MSRRKRAGDASECFTTRKSQLIARTEDANHGASPRALLPPLSSPLCIEQVEAHQVEDARCESLPQQMRSPSYKLRSSPRRAKAYPRLQTLEQLVERRVESMHDGNFVARSEGRWQSFQGAASDVDSVQGREFDPDKTLAYQIVRQSSAVAIQCYWRQYAATLIRRRLTALMWKRQKDAAAWISVSAGHLSQAMEMLTTGSARFSTATRALSVKFGRGLYFHLPASLLTWWIRFNCARASGRFLRRPPIVLRAIDIPVSRSMQLAARVWRTVSTIAATMLQSAVRSYYARQLMSKLRYDKRRQVAALRLQCFFGMLLAHRLVNRRRRRRRAAVKIQCSWRCHCARSVAMRRRVVRCAMIFTSGLLTESIRRIAEVTRQHAAVAIQKSYRASRARASFRHLASESQQRSWRQNPSKGLALFARMRYSEAALQLETCRRQGGFQEIDALVESMLESRGDPSPPATAPLVMAGSWMSFSFSAAPTTLGADWALGVARTSDWGGGSGREDAITTQVTSYLQFWHAYALSHLFTFEATGDLFNLRQARHGFETYQRVDDALNASTATVGQLDTDVHSMMRLLSMHCGYRLAKCLFLSDSPRDQDQALSLSLKWTSSLEQTPQELAPAATSWKAKLVMLSGMIYFQRGELQRSCQQLTELLELEGQTQYSELELRFAVALLLLPQLEAAAKLDSDSPGCESLSEQTTQLLQRCYQIVEMWPGVGFYHGEMSTSEAKSLVSAGPEGSFLLHHASANLTSDGATSTSGKVEDSGTASPPTSVAA